MNALAWVRSKATVFSTDTFEHEGKTIRVTYSSFRGNVPPRMIFQLREQLSQLANDGDREIETLHLNGQYRGDFGKCEYIRSVYEQVA